jgi:hypothetical protein
MNENNKSFYPSNMFEFIHHPEYGCRDLKGLIPVFNKNSPWAHTESKFDVLGVHGKLVKYVKDIISSFIVSTIHC